MATLYDLKPRFQKLLHPLVSKLAAAGVTANQITALALGLSALTGLLLLTMAGIRALLWLVAPVLLARMALNAIDGMLAREHGQASSFGFYFNELADVIADAALYVPLAATLAPLGVPAAAVVFFAFAAFVSEFAGVLAAADGGARRYDGPLGKSDRALGVGLITLWMASGIGGTGMVGPVFVLLALLALWGATNRVRAGLRQTGRRP